MILNITQIKSIIIDNPAKRIIAAGKEYNKILRRHLYGEGLGDYLAKIEGFERDEHHIVRKKYSRSNRDLFSRLSRPFDKVFTAKGGSIYFNLSETQDKQARAYAHNVSDDQSVRKWVETKWLPHLKDDPFGVVLMEILPTQDALLAKKQGRSVTYPTYKSITSIYDYLPKGGRLEYIVLEVSKHEKKSAGLKEEQIIYRVIDDANDYWIERTNEDVRILTDHTFPNYFGRVPGMVNSDIADPQNEGFFLSPYHDIIELAEHFVLYGSIRLKHDFIHGHPKAWQMAEGCPDCAGTMFQNGEPCKSCKGSGKKLQYKPQDITLIDFPSTKDDVHVPAPYAGFSELSETFHTISTNNLQTLEQLMNLTLWGAESGQQTQGMSAGADGETKTATQVMNDIKPQADRLQVFSEMAEKRHKFILDGVIQINLNLPFYPGSSVNYGRRYMIEGPDEIWDKYSSARSKGAPVSVLEDLLIEYYEAKYQGDGISLATAKKLMYVEPFVHLTPAQVDASQSITPEDKAAKTYFTEWLSSINEAMILSMSPELLKENLTEFVSEKAASIQAAADKKAETGFNKQAA